MFELISLNSPSQRSAILSTSHIDTLIEIFSIASLPFGGNEELDEIIAEHNRNANALRNGPNDGEALDEVMIIGGGPNALYAALVYYRLLSNLQTSILYTLLQPHSLLRTVVCIMILHTAFLQATTHMSLRDSHSSHNL